MRCFPQVSDARLELLLSGKAQDSLGLGGGGGVLKALCLFSPCPLAVCRVSLGHGGVPVRPGLWERRDMAMRKQQAASRSTRCQEAKESLFGRAGKGLFQGQRGRQGKRQQLAHEQTGHSRPSDANNVMWRDGCNDNVAPSFSCTMDDGTYVVGTWQKRWCGGPGEAADSLGRYLVP